MVSKNLDFKNALFDILNHLQEGNHEGHDFNMFRSQAGGACDCGNAAVMKESGYVCVYYHVH